MADPTTRSHVIAERDLLAGALGIIPGPTGGTVAVTLSEPHMIPDPEHDGESIQDGFTFTPAEIPEIRGGYAVAGRIGTLSAVILLSPRAQDLREYAEQTDPGAWFEVYDEGAQAIDASGGGWQDPYIPLEALNNYLSDNGLVTVDPGTNAAVTTAVFSQFRPGWVVGDDHVS